MSVRQIPEPGQPKKFPVGANGSFTYETELEQGVYDVSITGNDSFAASTYALTVTSPDGQVVPIHLDTGEGVVALPFNQNNTINAASIATPSIIEFSKVKYEQGDEPSAISVSFDSGFSGSYVVDMTIPADATQSYIYYDNGSVQQVGTSFPASVSSPTFDTAAAFDSGSVQFGYVYADDKGILSKGVSASLDYPTPPGAFATGGTVVTSGGYRYHKFTSNGTIDFLAGGDIEYIVVAGGGSGGFYDGGRAGGGGAGGLLSGSVSVSSGSIAITVGAGSGYNTNGNSSSLGALVSTVGGGRGGLDYAGSAGGSGGGGGGNGTVAGGAGTSGQGYAGGSSSGFYAEGGGGGGAGEAGNTDGQGSGGDGLQFSAWATATSSGDAGFYAGGGGGNSDTATRYGGDGGGGNGRVFTSAEANGMANTGGGGGGGVRSGTVGGYGGSGIILIRYAI